MSGWLLGVIAVLYLGTAISYAWQRNGGMALVFFAYAVANVGLILDGWSR